MSCAILLPSAGASRRMRGGDKLLETVGGEAVLRVIAQRALVASPHVAVTLRPGDRARAEAVAGLPLTCLTVTDAAEGMAASLRTGARWATGLTVTALMIALPDMPDITAQDMRALITDQARHPDQPLRACDPHLTPGHPTILPRALFPEIMRLSGDTGARNLLRAHPPRWHPLPGSRALDDLDTPEDWANWRARLR
ncbi:nucleotidyltransferase family protein [Natronohydrobacter thiooxidans]|uniref:nucleotidyltransferase family protein n=1 Tax=Natronohydrobacter thiooxidans TaxID=87172 RepID=UPI0008FF5462|nr:nucleotidyltransferase family protein [Natronohydrobacter thiooxidans]